MAKVYYNMWHISLWFAPTSGAQSLMTEYEIRENSISEELRFWSEIGFSEDEYSMEYDRRYLDKYVEGKGMFSVVAELVEYEEEQESVFDET